MYIIPTVPPVVYQNRLAQCKECKWYKASTGSCGTLIMGEVVTDEDNIVRHYRKPIRLCGCVMKWKAKYRLSSCPAGKWSSEAIDATEIEKLREFVTSIEKRDKLMSDEVRDLARWFSKVSGQTHPVTTCPPCVRDMITELRKEVERVTTKNPVSQ